MSIEELGALSDIVGSMAVLLTLVVLVFQISRTRSEISRANARDLIRHNNEILLKMSENPELLDVHARAQQDFSSLTETERMQWGYWMFAWITQTEQGFVDQYKKEFTGMELDQYVEGVALILRSDGGKALWPRMKFWFDPAFSAAVDRQVATSTETYRERIIDFPWPPSTPIDPKA